VPGAAPLIADNIEDYTHGRERLELPPLDVPARLSAHVGT
jgi:hypothetical protein